MSEDKKNFTLRFQEILHRRSIALMDAVQQRIGDYFYALHAANQTTNLTGYSSLEDFVDFHLIDTLALLNLIQFPPMVRVTDVGSGAGIPGLLVKLFRNDLLICLIESNQKKSSFLQTICREQKLEDIEILPQRAEEVAHDIQFRERSDFVIARALGSFSTALELTAGFARPGGWIVLPRGGEETIENDQLPCIPILGCQLEKSVSYQIPRRDTPFQAIFIKKIENLSEKYPRKPGQIRKRPL